MQASSFPFRCHPSGAFGIGGVAGFRGGSMALMAAAILLLGRDTSNRSLEAIAAASDAPDGPVGRAVLMND